MYTAGVAIEAPAPRLFYMHLVGVELGYDIVSHPYDMRVRVRRDSTSTSKRAGQLLSR
jgi:hypothetical protein